MIVAFSMNIEENIMLSKQSRKIPYILVLNNQHVDNTVANIHSDFICYCRLKIISLIEIRIV